MVPCRANARKEVSTIELESVVGWLVCLLALVWLVGWLECLSCRGVLPDLEVEPTASGWIFLPRR